MRSPVRLPRGMSALGISAPMKRTSCPLGNSRLLHCRGGVASSLGDLLTLPGYHGPDLLTLDASKSKTILGGQEKLPITNDVNWTVGWHEVVSSRKNPQTLTREQISKFLALS